MFQEDVNDKPPKTGDLLEFGLGSVQAHAVLCVVKGDGQAAGRWMAENHMSLDSLFKGVSASGPPLGCGYPLNQPMWIMYNA